MNAHPVRTDRARREGMAAPGRPLVRVSLVEDEELLRGMLRERLQNSAQVNLVAALSSIAEAELVITPGSVDVAMLDIHLSDGTGVSLGRALQRRDPRLRIVLLSSHDMMDSVATLAGPDGTPWSYLSKRSAFAHDALERVIRATASGRPVLDPYLVARSTPRSGSELSRLTPMQLIVLKDMAAGLSNAAIARKLNLSPRSVESHAVSIYRALGIASTDQNRRVSAVLHFLRQSGRSWNA